MSKCLTVWLDDRTTRWFILSFGLYDWGLPGNQADRQSVGRTIGRLVGWLVVWVRKLYLSETPTENRAILSEEKVKKLIDYKFHWQ